MFATKNHQEKEWAKRSKLNAPVGPGPLGNGPSHLVHKVLLPCEVLCSIIRTVLNCQIGAANLIRALDLGSIIWGPGVSFGATIFLSVAAE